MLRRFWTTYFGGLKRLEGSPEIVPVSICGKPIPGWTGLEYKKLAPSWSIYKEYKDTGDEERYVRRYTTEILGRLTREEVISEILDLIPEDKEPALVCYEKPGDFCHRHLVAGWLKEGGIEINEKG